MFASKYIPANQIVIVDEIDKPKDWGNISGRFNARSADSPGFTPERMEAIREDIRKEGLDSPLAVRDNKGTYLLLAGERRLRSILALVKSNADCWDSVSKKWMKATALYIERGIECRIKQYENPKDYIRASVSENILHEPLTEYEILMEVKRMRDCGFTRQEQAEAINLGMSWLTQSHQILDGDPKVVEYLRMGKITRTHAITFNDVPQEKIKEVLEELDRLGQNKSAKVATLIEAKVDAAKAVGKADAVIKMADFLKVDSTPEIRNAYKAKSSSQRKLSTFRRKVNKSESKFSGSEVIAAIKSVDGAADTVNKTHSYAEARKQIELIESGEIPPGITQQNLDGLLSGLKWILDFHVKTPFDFIPISE